jgi:hypothetical protein
MRKKLDTSTLDHKTNQVRHFVNVINGFETPKLSMTKDIFVECMEIYGSTDQINSFMASRYRMPFVLSVNSDLTTVPTAMINNLD